MFMWPDALPVTNQQELLVVPILFLTTKTPEQGKGHLYVVFPTPLPHFGKLNKSDTLF